MTSPYRKKAALAVACAITVATLAAASTAANAQSTVTLYGELDAGLAYANNVGGHAQYQLATGLIDGSFWGLQGSEDLGGGMKALFRLERGFSVANGEERNDHPYYVGLESESFGTVTLGHQYDSIHDYFAPFTLTGSAGGTAFAHPFDNDNANNTYLAANAIKYTSPTLAGFTFGGMYAFSNGAGRFADNRAYSLGANYAAGSFNAGVAWLHANNRGATGAGAYDPLALPGSSGDIVDTFVQKQDTIGVGANYAFGDVTLGAAWSRAIQTGIVDADSGAGLPSIAFSNYELNAVWQVTPTVSLTGMYVYTKASSAHWNEGGVQAIYQLSKRTDVYAETLYQRATAGAPAAINAFDPSSGRNQLVVATGIRHRF
ncbi:porin [Paraburkholderia sp. Ac-20340]|uniref:porin n=1 Tax=Paraburkholderia sp. Ac-20340 TaxID=2703888 RepID=UPI00197F8106|nr:porin [Paraburkholderia sp. Ac-20340]MBN3854267.1 porin [Paraburkholderia sp. Ac-20340]